MLLPAPFLHVPGHKWDKGCLNYGLCGETVLRMDLTCLPGLDNICNPRDVIKEAEELAAEAFGADRAFFLVNGTTAGIQAMIMAVCRPGEKLILPRNAHKSAISGLIISGAQPVYIEPEINQDFGISMGVTVEKVEKALQQHPDAKGVFLANPNYYGTASDLKSIVEIAHGYKVPVIVDEAHGAHLPFGDGLPMPALAAGADLAASSTHKMGGSLTQSSMLFLRQGLVSVRGSRPCQFGPDHSPSYLLLSSLDLARKQMALKGRELVRKSLALARWIREELKSIEGIRLFGEGLAGSPGCYAFDPLKVVINVTGLGMSGYEVERLLREKYNLQVELSDLYNVMFLISLGDNMDNCRYLVDCLKSIAGTKKLGNIIKYCPPPPEIPGMAVLPRDAFYSETRIVPLHEAAGEVSAEAIMAYPPGIPLLCPGEMITQEIIDYVNILKQENADLQGTEDPEINQIKVLKKVYPVLARDDAVGLKN